MTEDVPNRFERLWTIDQPADYLTLSKRTPYGWLVASSAPSYRLGNQIRYDPRKCAPGWS